MKDADDTVDSTRDDASPETLVGPLRTLIDPAYRRGDGWVRVARPLLGDPTACAWAPLSSLGRDAEFLRLAPKPQGNALSDSTRGGIERSHKLSK